MQISEKELNQLKEDLKKEILADLKKQSKYLFGIRIHH